MKYMDLSPHTAQKLSRKEEERRAKVYADFSSQEYECLRDALGLITVNKHLNLDKAMKMLQWFQAVHLSMHPACDK